MEEKREAALAKLEASRAARRVEQQKKKDTRSEEEVSRTDIDTFLVEFNSIISEINKKWEQVDLHAGNTVFDSATTLVEQAQRLLAEASLFLPKHDIRVSQNVLAAVSEKVSSLRKGPEIKKKFAFSSRAANTTSSLAVPPVETTKSSIFQPEAFIPAQPEEKTKLHSKSNEDLFFEHQFVGADLHISDCENCKIVIYDHLGALRIDHVNNSVILVGAVGGSVHIEKCNNCVFLFSSRQVRVHDVFHTDFFVNVQSGPIIEKSCSLRFGEFIVNAEVYPNYPHDVKASLLDTNRNLWKDVQDFNWLKAQHSPNWSLIEGSEAENKKLVGYIFME